MAKFFLGAAAEGYLRLRDMPDGSQWKSQRIVYWDELYIDAVARLALAGQKVQSAAELDEMLSVSRELRVTRSIWIHEDLLEEVQRRWARRNAAKQRWRVRGPAMVATGLAAAAAAVLIGFAGVPQRPDLVSRPNGRTARVPGPGAATMLSKSAPAGTSAVTRPAGAPSHPRRLPSIQARAVTAAYAVSAGRFLSAAAAERMKHVAGRKGYIMIVVPRGALSELTTPPYRTREQAERIAHGLRAAGVPAQLVARHYLKSGQRTSTY